MNLSLSSADAAETVTCPPDRRRTPLLRRLCWPLFALLLSIFIALGALPLKGQSTPPGQGTSPPGQGGTPPGQGNPPSHGFWSITVSYTGAAQFTLTESSPNMSGSAKFLTVDNTAYNGSLDLSTIQPSTTFVGTATADVTGGMTFAATHIGKASLNLNLTGASIVYVFTWLPDLALLSDPPPKKIVICYRRQVTLSDYAQIVAPFTTFNISIQAGIDAINDSLASTASQYTGTVNITKPTVYDSPIVMEMLDVTGGTATKTFHLNNTVKTSFDAQPNPQAPGNTGVSQTISSASFDEKVMLGIADFDMARFGGATTPLGGGSHNGSSDPTFTRWLPLAFSPQMTSQPFRYQAGTLPGPWGNINCMYSLALRQEPPTPNYDLDGRALLYIPKIFNSTGPAFAVIPDGNAPQYSLTDATSDRLLFDTTWNPIGNVHSTLTNQGNGFFQLANAGPPGALRDKGNYIYTLRAINPPGQPLITRLISLQDDLGNIQTLNWSAPNAFTVTDSSSGRSLVFNGGANGSIGSVDAPEIGGGIHTHTALTWDGSGHCTAVKVYDGVTNNLLHSDTFGYGGANGDSIVLVQQGVSTLSYVFLADGLTPDPFGLATPRLSSVTFGSGSDNNSSDDGGGGAGTVSYTYGPQQWGYTYWGVAAHTNTVTDARGTIFRSIFELSNDVEGDLVGLTSVGPAFTGATGANKVRTTYGPNMDHPQSISVFDQLYYAGLSAQPWMTSLDLLGNLTSVSDPLGNVWNFGYTADGKYLASINDPMGIGLAFSYGDRNNPASRLTTISDPATGTTQIDYNAFGQPSVITRSSAAGLAQTISTYNPTTGDLIQVLGPTGDALNITGYDALGDPLGVAVYPDTGNAATSTQPLSSSIVCNAAQLPTLLA